MSTLSTVNSGKVAAMTAGIEAVNFKGKESAAEPKVALDAIVTADTTKQEQEQIKVSKQIESLNSQMTPLLKQQANLVKKINKMQSACVALQKESTLKLEEASDKQKAIDGLNTQMTTLNTQVEALKQQINRLAKPSTGLWSYLGY